MLVTRQIKSVYTDGACTGNPGPGGWGTVVYFTDGSVHEIGGATAKTTNNRMELQAAIEGLKALKRPSTVELYTDSTYVKTGITQWIHNWKKNNWKTSNKKSPVKNADLWEELDAVTAQHEVSWHWVKGHAGHPENERADELARLGITTT